MEDRQLYEQILGIGSPWYVGRVELKLDQGQGAVHVYVNHQLIQTWSCGECGQPCALYDHQPERQWRHLDTWIEAGQQSLTLKTLKPLGKFGVAAWELIKVE